MIEIISKSDGPRREDERARRLIEANRGVITGLADRLTNGAYSARRRAGPPAEPQAQGLIIHTARASTAAGPAEPFVRVAVNGRVSLVDAATGRQMHHLGDLRRQNGATVFRLATKANGFFSPVDPEIAEALAEVDGQALESGEDALISAIGRRLGVA